MRPDWFRVFDPLEWFAARVQVPPNLFVKLSEIPPPHRFPGRDVAEVRAFDIGVEPGTVNGSRRIGARCSIVSADGTLCPQLLAPGLSLTSDQLARLLPVVASPHFLDRSFNRWNRSTCSDLPVSAFVFFDAEGRPIGYTTLSSTLASWDFVPPPKGSPRCTKETAPAERDVIASLCEELNLRCSQPAPLCSESTLDGRTTYDAQQDDKLEEVARRELRALLLPIEDVSTKATLNATNEADRRRLCAWHYRAVSAATEAGLGYSWSHNPEASIGRVGQPWAMKLKNFEECLREFPKCDMSVGDAVKSLSVVYRSIADEMPERPRGCVFGVDIIASPASNE